jgi:hypothetical protein
MDTDLAVGVHWVRLCQTSSVLIAQLWTALWTIWREWIWQVQHYILPSAPHAPY